METFLKIKYLCVNIVENPNDCINNVKHLQQLISDVPSQTLQNLQPVILSAFYPIFKNISERQSSYTEDNRKIIIDMLQLLFCKTRIEKLGLFFNIYALLLFEIYDHKHHSVTNIHEEYKQSIVQCMTSLIKSLSWDVISLLYQKEHVPKLSQMLYVITEVAKKEQLRSLRISAMQCIMAMAHVHDESDFNDIEIRNQIANIFMFFLPGIATGFQEIALEDEKSGHKVIMTALKTWGRIVTLVMQDYNPIDKKFDLNNFNVNENKQQIKIKWGSENEVKEYLQTSNRDKKWYKESDLKLAKIIKKFSKLLHHSHEKVRLELADMCSTIINSCVFTMPNSTCNVIELLIALSEDESEMVSSKCNILNNLSEKISSHAYMNLLENLEDGFYNTISSLPRNFNALDEKEQLAALNMLAGYINLFGKSKLKHILHSPLTLQRLMQSLFFIAELEKAETSLEEYPVKELSLSDSKTPWKVFKRFRSNSIKHKLENSCRLFAKYEVIDIISDFLLDVYDNDAENKKEATLIMNEILSGCENVPNNMHIIKNVLQTYLQTENWYLPLEVSEKCNLSEVQSNIIQICLQTEGIGKIAIVCGEQFQQFMLKTLYIILEQAGSGHPLVKTSGLIAIKNISTSCKYSSITELVNENTDYFSYHVIRKLKRSECNEGVLNVLTIVMTYSSIEILPSVSDIIDGVLMESCDRFQKNNINPYLRVFKIFVQCLHRWLNVQIKMQPLESKKEKRQKLEQQHFEVSDLNYDTNYSDEIMGKTAEEMWKEDMSNKQQEIEDELNGTENTEDGEYKKPELPSHIKLVVSILSRSLNFLPSKDKTRKLLVLEILQNGIEIIRNWEDELLPLVHKIWSPLVDRFKEFEEPLVINYSFQLLCTLGRLSKDFIRSRTVKDVLPNILQVLNKLSKESYLKDYGSAYRYTQAYKLQLVLLERLAALCIHLDFSDKDIEMVMDAVLPYLSNKQPVPLQDACKMFFDAIKNYDADLVQKKLVQVTNHKKYTDSEYQTNIESVLGNT